MILNVHIGQEHVLQLVAEKSQELGKDIESNLAITKQILNGPITDEIIGKYFYDVLNLFSEPEEVLDNFAIADPKIVNKKLAEHFMTGELLTFDYRDKLKDTQCPVLFLSDDQGPLHSLKTDKDLIAAFSEDKIRYKIFENAKPACYEFYPQKAEKMIKKFITEVN